MSKKRKAEPVCPDAAAFYDELVRKGQKKIIRTYEIIRLIGEGGNGKVFYAINKKADKKVALKRVVSNLNNDFGVGMGIDVLRESILQREVSHPYILQMTHSFHLGQVFVFELEYLPLTLHTRMNQLATQGARSLGQAWSWHYLSHIMLALDYLHANRIMHRDVSPRNMLLTEDLKLLKISDFGSARRPSQMVNSPGQETTCAHYRAMEMILGQSDYDFKVDVWAAGLTLATMMTLRTIFPSEADYPNLMTMFKVFGTPTEETWPGVTELPYYSPRFPQWQGPNWSEVGLEENLPMLRLCRIMLVPNPARRPTTSRVLDIMKMDEFNMYEQFQRDENVFPEGGGPVTPPRA